MPFLIDNAGLVVLVGFGLMVLGTMFMAFATPEPKADTTTT